MPTGAQYLALLRGINVGGQSLMKMADLRAVFEEMGFTEVATYIRAETSSSGLRAFAIAPSR
jgi:uncharacterized protein (DUF1697 family)